VLAGVALVLTCATLGALGIDVLRRAIRIGIGAEIVASVGIGLALLFVFREHPPSLLTHGLGAPALGGMSNAGALLAALAVGGWVFIGFDACVGAAEETHEAARHVPRAIWIAMLGVGTLVILDAVAAGLAHPDPAAIIAGEDVDPVTTAVTTSFGTWSMRPFAAVVLAAFLACGIAAQAVTARVMYSVARDGVLPGSRWLTRIDRRRSPVGATVVTAAIACLGLLLGLDTTAVGSLIAFGTAAIYVSFLMIAVAALVARVSGRWVPGGAVRLGRAGLPINVLAVVWLTIETVNIAWPRAVLAPPGAPFYQVWAAPLVLGVIATAGVAYLLVARPQRRLPAAAATRRR
jgi:amino acid transporter